MIVKISKINTVNGVRSVSIVRHAACEPMVMQSDFGPTVRVINRKGNIIDYVSTPGLQITKVKVIGA